MIVLAENGKLAIAPISPTGFNSTAQASLLSGTCYTTPALVDGRLYLRSNEEMVCVDLRE